MICCDSPRHLHSGACNPCRCFEQRCNFGAFPPLLESKKGLSSSACRTREVAAAIEAAGVFDGSAARITLRISLLYILEKALVPHPSTFHWIFQTNFYFVVIQCPELRMSKRNGWRCWVWTVILAYV